MKNHKSALSSWFIIPIILILVGMIYLGGAAFSASNKQPQSVVKINNLTHSLEVMSVEEHEDQIKLSLKNNSSKSITAYVLSSEATRGDGFKIIKEFAYSEIDYVIAPGSVYEMSAVLPADLSSQKNPSIDLSAVIFEDKSSEGDQQVAQEIEYERLGQKTQLERAIPVLEKMLTLNDSKMHAYSDQNLKRDLEASLSSPADDLQARLKNASPHSMNQRTIDSLSGQIEVGMHGGKEYILGRIRNLEDERRMNAYGRDLREQITSMKQIWEKIIARL
jgi:hypothetical protein